MALGLAPSAPPRAEGYETALAELLRAVWQGLSGFKAAAERLQRALRLAGGVPRALTLL